MRKPDRTKIPAVAALLLSSDLRLLVRHARDHAIWTDATMQSGADASHHRGDQQASVDVLLTAAEVFGISRAFPRSRASDPS